MKLFGKETTNQRVTDTTVTTTNWIEHIIASCPKYQRERRSYQIEENTKEATRAVNRCSSVSNFSKRLNIFSFIRFNVRCLSLSLRKLTWLPMTSMN